MPYTVTIYAARGGTPLLDNGMPTGDVSSAGHMWYELSDGDTSKSYGFVPAEAGKTGVAGKVIHTDTDSYDQPAYARTLEITEEQYRKLQEFGDAGSRGDWSHFDQTYRVATNSCVDFTWGALKHADLQIETSYGRGGKRTGDIPDSYEGQLIPKNNESMIDKIVPPVPGSDLNRKETHPAPETGGYWFTENDATPEQRQLAQQFKDQAGPRLAVMGRSQGDIDTLAAAAVSHVGNVPSLGAPRAFLVSKDNATIGVSYANYHSTEFPIDKALAQGANALWADAARGVEAPVLADAAPRADHPTMSAPVMQRA